MPYDTMKRPYKAIQDHTRSHNAMLSRMRPHMAIAVKSSNKAIRGHSRPHKAIQDYKRPHKAIKGKHDN